MHQQDGEDSGNQNDVYVMSSEVGSKRYMAPEVFKCQPYNQKVDIYAFGK